MKFLAKKGNTLRKNSRKSRDVDELRRQQISYDYSQYLPQDIPEPTWQEPAYESRYYQDRYAPQPSINSGNSNWDDEDMTVEFHHPAAEYTSMNDAEAPPPPDFAADDMPYYSPDSFIYVAHEAERQYRRSLEMQYQEEEQGQGQDIPSPPPRNPRRSALSCRTSFSTTGSPYSLYDLYESPLEDEEVSPVSSQTPSPSNSVRRPEASTLVPEPLSPRRHSMQTPSRSENGSYEDPDANWRPVTRNFSRHMSMAAPKSTIKGFELY
jgi:hypothetical protein